MQKEALKVLKQALFAKLSRCILGNLTKDSGAQLCETFSSLIKLSADTEDVWDLIKNLPNVLQNVDSFER